MNQNNKDPTWIDKLFVTKKWVAHNREQRENEKAVREQHERELKLKKEEEARNEQKEKLQRQVSSFASTLGRIDKSITSVRGKLDAFRRDADAIVKEVRGSSIPPSNRQKSEYNQLMNRIEFYNTNLQRLEECEIQYSEAKSKAETYLDWLHILDTNLTGLEKVWRFVEEMDDKLCALDQELALPGLEAARYGTQFGDQLQNIWEKTYALAPRTPDRETNPIIHTAE